MNKDFMYQLHFHDIIKSKELNNLFSDYVYCIAKPSCQITSVTDVINSKSRYISITYKANNNNNQEVHEIPDLMEFAQIYLQTEDVDYQVLKKSSQNSVCFEFCANHQVLSISFSSV